MPDSLSIVSRDGAVPGLRVLRLSGRLGLDSVPDFLKAVRAQTHKTVVLDMCDMAYVDSSGVGALVQQLSALKKEGRRLVLVKPHERVLAVLQITKVLSLFSRFDSVEAAEAQFR